MIRVFEELYVSVFFKNLLIIVIISVAVLDLLVDILVIIFVGDYAKFCIT